MYLLQEFIKKLPHKFKKNLPIVNIMEIGGGTNVPIKFRDPNLCMHVTFPWSARFYLAFLGDGCAFFQHRKIGFKLTF